MTTWWCSSAPAGPALTTPNLLDLLAGHNRRRVPNASAQTRPGGIEEQATTAPTMVRPGPFGHIRFRRALVRGAGESESARTVHRRRKKGVDGPPAVDARMTGKARLRRCCSRYQEGRS